MNPLQRKKRNLSRDALQIFNDALESVHPGNLVPQSVKREGDSLHIADATYRFSDFKNVYVVGAGKATAAIADGIEKLLLDKITSGLVIVKYQHGLPLQKIELVEAGHPVPDDSGLKASQKILDLVKKADESDLVLVLISGGGSALMELPVENISLSDIQIVTERLLASGAGITEMNALRKHLSKIKGGQLAAAAAPATVITLAISDVIGDSPASIASGPTVPDNSTFSNAWSVIEKYDLENRLPDSVINHIQDGLSGQARETPKSDNPAFNMTHFHLIGNNRIFLDSAALIADKFGYQSIILTDRLQGEARRRGAEIAALGKSCATRAEHRPLCLLAGGETTVTLKGSGTGGRNQELALSAAIELNSTKNCVFLAAGTDGTDGHTEAAGALVDDQTLARAHKLGLEVNDFL
ncbi:glycerate kinase, partial [bacterium]|nr:glycerate kinase [bacterium]